MAAQESSEMNLDRLDYASLKKLQDEVAARMQEKRDNEIKTLVDGWAKKAIANGFTVSEVIEEMRKYLPPDEQKGPTAGGTASKGPKPYKMGSVYKNPNGPETWVGGTKGHQPPWLKELAPDTLPPAERKARFDAIEVAK